jgi:AraC-like DNA-binding protein
VDILTDALTSMRTGNPVSARTDCRAPWGLRFSEQAGAGFHVVLGGTCWLIDPAGGRTALGPGDIVFVRRGREHVLADDPASPVTDYRTDLSWPVSPLPSAPAEGDGPLTSLLCGSYHLDQERPHPLVSALPDLIHLPARRGRHLALTSAIDMLGAELERPGPGADGIVAQLIDLLLLYILRAWLDEQPADAAAGWAAALRDPAIAPALKSIHADPGRPWTVEGLGDSVGLSRAAFARRFTALVGEPPLAYLTRWRMTTAAGLLRHSETPLGVVGGRVGYGSEFAFAKAFKRAYGVPPGQYRREARPAA